MNDTIILIYSPFPTTDTARTAGTLLLEEKLVACCNLSAEGESLYRWEGKLTTEQECYLLAKTTSALAPAAASRMAAIHPYECPAILTFEASANAPFAAWVKAETQK